MAVSRIPVKEVQFSCVCDEKRYIHVLSYIDCAEITVLQRCDVFFLCCANCLFLSFNYVGDGRRIPFLLGQGVMRIGIRKTLVEKNGKHFLQHDDDATQVESIKSNTTGKI